jgi:protein-tyrosine phosphatase
MPGSILVVCTGNICRSPIAEGMLRAMLEERLGEAAPLVASAGTAGWDGRPATEEAVAAAADLGVDIAGHRARELGAEHIRAADLVIGMTEEHAEVVLALEPTAAERTFTLKELVRLLEAVPAPEVGPTPLETLRARVRQADALRRRGVVRNPFDTGVVDPLGEGLQVYRAVAWELREWCARLVDALVGEAPSARAAAEG